VYEYCWAITQAAGWSRCGRSGPISLGVRISTGPPRTVHRYRCMPNYDLRKPLILPLARMSVQKKIDV